jgi:hypothetical protein
MPTPNANPLPPRTSLQRCDHPALSQRCDLRPDLAAFFVARSREIAPARIVAEQGVLAELRVSRGWK